MWQKIASDKLLESFVCDEVSEGLRLEYYSLHYDWSQLKAVENQRAERPLEIYSMKTLVQL